MIYINTANRVHWNGYGQQMVKSGVSQSIFLVRPREKIRVGRPTLRLLDEVVKDIRELGVIFWGSTAMDRIGCGKLWSRLL